GPHLLRSAWCPQRAPVLAGADRSGAARPGVRHRAGGLGEPDGARHGRLLAHRSPPGQERAGDAGGCVLPGDGHCRLPDRHHEQDRHPSILGFESLYVAVQTGAIYLLGATGLTMLTGVPQFVGQIVLMVALAVLLYGWLLSGKHGNLHVLLLIGIIIGAGLGSVSTFL